MTLALEKLREMGLSLPAPAQAIANYVPYVVEDGWIHVSGQLPLRDGAIAHAGLVGADVTVEQGYDAARLCALSALGHLAAAAGDLDRVRIVRVGGFVASAPGFTDQPQVVNGASDLLVAVLGERGRHARAAVGVASLPRNAAVEVEVLARLT
ncbi:MAG: RidA family protein [Candidatus Sericytochromatia bacterium]|nr:RidA family protein [Candidatus Tanganyikabacteria bacterium]